MEPQAFGPFVLLDALATGGMGEVWLASPRGIGTASGDLCVLKRVKSALADDDDTLKRFVDESRLGLLLRHPCVCRTIDAGRADGSDYLAVELVEGIDLRALVERATRGGFTVDLELALWITACAFDGLAYAHQARHPLTNESLGVVHRDISPHNVMVAKDGISHVIDFGLALSSLREARTEQGIVMGKLAYMSPEQARGEAVDGACDVYAMGVVLYEVITGKRFWGNQSNHEIWSQIGSGEYIPLHFDDVNKSTGGLLAALLHPKPGARVSAAQARDVLLAQLAAGAGAADAKRRLSGLIETLASPELERAARARALAASSQPKAIEYPPTTISLALTELAAVEALLAQATPTVAMTATSTPTLPPITLMSPTMPSTRAVELPGMSSGALPPPPAAVTERVERALNVVKVTPPPPPPTVPSRPTSSSSSLTKVIVAIAVVAVVVGVAIGLASAPETAVAEAPPPPTPTTVPTPAPVPPVAPVESWDAALPPAPPPPPSPPSPSPAPASPPPAAPRDPLMRRAQRLKSCDVNNCGVVISKLIKQGLEPRHVATNMITSCEKQCR
jgi:serine/threonine-protein kinase